MQGGGAVALGVIQCGLAVLVPKPRHVRVPELVHVPHHIRHTRDTVEAGPGPSPLVGGEGATAEKILEIVGPGLQRSLFNFLVSTTAVCKIILSACIYFIVCREIALLDSITFD